MPRTDYLIATVLATIALMGTLDAFVVICYFWR
jgi:hypothetical protein